jgi:hypothetical protein
MPVPRKASILIYHCLPLDEVPKIQAKPERECPRARQVQGPPVLCSFLLPFQGNARNPECTKSGVKGCEEHNFTPFTSERSIPISGMCIKQAIRRCLSDNRGWGGLNETTFIEGCGGRSHVLVTFRFHKSGRFVGLAAEFSTSVERQIKVEAHRGNRAFGQF